MLVVHPHLREVRPSFAPFHRRRVAKLFRDDVRLRRLPGILASLQGLRVRERLPLFERLERIDGFRRGRVGIRAGVRVGVAVLSARRRRLIRVLRALVLRLVERARLVLGHHLVEGHHRFRSLARIALIRDGVRVDVVLDDRDVGLARHGILDVGDERVSRVVAEVGLGAVIIFGRAEARSDRLGEGVHVRLAEGVQAIVLGVVKSGRGDGEMVRGDGRARGVDREVDRVAEARDVRSRSDAGHHREGPDRGDRGDRGEDAAGAAPGLRGGQIEGHDAVFVHAR